MRSHSQYSSMSGRRNVPIWKRRCYLEEKQESFRAKEEIRRIKNVEFTRQVRSNDYVTRDF